MTTNTYEIYPGYNCQKCDEAIIIPVDGLSPEPGETATFKCSSCGNALYVEWKIILEDNIMTYETYVSCDLREQDGYDFI